MRAAFGIAEADHLDPLFGVIDGVLPAIAGHIHALGIEKLWRGLGTTGGEEQKDHQGFHPHSLPGID